MGSISSTVQIPVNRVEGDLEVRVQIDDGVVTEAWSIGTLYRGFENLLVGRAPMDALVITPRICGLCSVSHLSAAARALDALTSARPTPNAIRIRNLALMVEDVQNDIRQAILMFAPDFASAAYAGRPFHDEAVERYEPLRGTSVVAAINATRHLLEIVAILGGQWPHSAFIVPGGVVSRPAVADLVQCRMVLRELTQFYERQILGCSLDRWREVTSAAKLDSWLEERSEHATGDIGTLLRLCRAVGADSWGGGHETYISFGGFDLPESPSGEPDGPGDQQLVRAGFASPEGIEPLDPAQVTEDVIHSWYTDTGPRHPAEGVTSPYATGDEGDRYSWGKTVRYRGRPAETGALAQAVVAGDPLITDLLARHGGATAAVRELARLARPARMLEVMDRWLGDMVANGREYFAEPGSVRDEAACGLLDAARGALGHWCEVADGKISRYQIIAPTTWNASPRDAEGVRGPWEEAVVGTPVRDPKSPVEVGHVIRSFDPCMVCCVHAVTDGRSHCRWRG